MSDESNCEYPDKFRLGLGTGNLRDLETCKETVLRALELGYRHIDTARQYQNEGAIGAALRESDIDRDEVFIATKVHSKNLHRNGIRRSIVSSRQALGIKTLDLVYVHWPAHTYDPDETLPALVEARDEGLIQHVGLCNVTPQLTTEAVEEYEAPIFAVQIEMHPFLQQKSHHEMLKDYGIWTVAHTPLAQGEVFDNPVISDVADTYGISEAQVTLAWLVQKDRVAVVPGTGGNHLAENFAAKSVSLERRHIERINDIGEGVRLVDYEFAPWNE